MEGSGRIVSFSVYLAAPPPKKETTVSTGGRGSWVVPRPGEYRPARLSYPGYLPYLWKENEKNIHTETGSGSKTEK
jgi:hypothetical protein